MTNDRFFSDVLKKSECEYQENCDLSSYSSARLPSVVKAVVFPDDENKFVNIISALEDKGLPYKVIGGFSNLLIKDGIYNDIIIKTDKILTKTLAENRITLGCGIRMSGIIMKMASFGLGGMEGLSGIPGTVGGMVKQNAGAFGYEISDRFTEALCYLPKESKVKIISKADMDFSYRHSLLTDVSAILLSATFDFLPQSKDGIFSQIREFRSKRLLTQPIGYPSLGSVFKRYNGIGAGYYVDKCGLKGFSVGGAEVSYKHAGFIVNKGGATADDFLKVLEYVKNRVFTVFGIELEEEIEII